MSDFTDEELLAFLDEQLPVERMTVIEKALRTQPALQHRVAQLADDRDHNLLTVGAIWRRRRLSCPSRSQLGAYLLDTLDLELRTYVEFHVQTVGCRYCAANLEDLRQASAPSAKVQQRRQKYFQSSAGQLSQWESGD